MPSDPQAAEFFQSAKWKNRFEDEVLTAARAFVSKVREPRLDEAAPGSFVLLASVAGEETEVVFWQDDGAWDFETSCSCEVGNFCHHAAALLMKAEKERDLARFSGNSVKAAVAAELQREQPAAPSANLPRISPQPSFELHVVREPVDRASKLLLQSLGQPDVDRWIFAEATVIYDIHRSPLRGSMPDWTSEIILPDGRRATLEHSAAAENTAARQLSETGLSSLQSNSAWRFLLNLKSRDNKHAPARDRWFPDPSRIDVDHFWHQFRGEMVERLESLGWQLTIDDNVGHRVFDADPDRWDGSLAASGGGWFSLSVGFDVGGERHDLLPILAKLLEGDFLEETLHCPDTAHVYAPLPNGDALKLPAGRVRRILHHLAALIDPKFPGKTKLHALDASSLAGLGIETPPELSELSAKLRDFRGIEAVTPPAGLNATL
ncbi:MAG TPA: SWIM zinc finger family protein, partial [Luteolibacter sp.]|nr:SWIM zinc finger family protein [Luteolibacter sp.]